MGFFDFFKKKNKQTENADLPQEQDIVQVESETEVLPEEPAEMAVVEETTAGVSKETINEVADLPFAKPDMVSDTIIVEETQSENKPDMPEHIENTKPEAVLETVFSENTENENLEKNLQSFSEEMAENSENTVVVSEVAPYAENIVASDEPMTEEMPAEEPEVLEEVPVEAPAKKGFFQKLVEGLTKTRDHVMQGVNDVLSSFTSIDEEFYEELEEALIIGDLGVNTAIKIVEGLKQKVKERKIKEPQAVKALLKEELKEQMYTQPEAYDFIQKKSVILVIGVNGVGKTTTIGKLASQYKKAGKTVMLAAADTFRAAAIDQLKEWANRADVPIVAQAENSDPGAVIFDAIASAKSRGTDILICDTAGRLHNKKNLMAELGKIYRIIGREYPEAHLEVFLVLDSTTGQNALAQAKEFKEMADITGIVLTKLDGTSKGGIAIAISADLKLPVKYIGVGEGIDDLRPFDADSFVEALFEE